MGIPVFQMFNLPDWSSSFLTLFLLFSTFVFFAFLADLRSTSSTIWSLQVYDFYKFYKPPDASVRYCCHGSCFTDDQTGAQRDEVATYPASSGGAGICTQAIWLQRITACGCEPGSGAEGQEDPGWPGLAPCQAGGPCRRREGGDRVEYLTLGGSAVFLQTHLWESRGGGLLLTCPCLVLGSWTQPLGACFLAWDGLSLRAGCDGLVQASMGSGARLRAWLGSPHPSGLWLSPSPSAVGSAAGPRSLPRPPVGVRACSLRAPAGWQLPLCPSVFSTSYSPPYKTFLESNIYQDPYCSSSEHSPLKIYFLKEVSHTEELWLIFLGVIWYTKKKLLKIKEKACEVKTISK